MNFLFVLLIIGVTILALILGVVILIVCLAPLRITFKRSQSIAYELDFGLEMVNVWQSLYWFSITKVYYNIHHDVEHADLIFSLFRCENYWIKRNQREADRLNWD